VRRLVAGASGVKALPCAALRAFAFALAHLFPGGLMGKTVATAIRSNTAMIG